MIEKNFSCYNPHLEGSRVELSSSHNFIATVGSDDIIFIIDSSLKQSNTIQLRNQERLQITAFAIHPELPNYFVFGTSNGFVKFMRPIHKNQLQKAQTLIKRDKQIASLNFSSSGKYLGIADEQQSILYCMKSKKITKLVKQHEGFVNKISFGKDQYIYSIGSEGYLHLYSISNQQTAFQQDQDQSQDPFEEAAAPVQISFLGNFKISVQNIARAFPFLNASFAQLLSQGGSQKVIFCAGLSSLQTIQIQNGEAVYKLERQVKEDSQMLIVQSLHGGGNNKAKTLVVSTEKTLSVWNYSLFERIIFININQELRSFVTCICPVYQDSISSFAFILKNKDSNGKIYQFTNQSLLNVDQSRPQAQQANNAIEEQKQDQEKCSEMSEKEQISATRKLVTVYPQFPLQKNYEEYNRARFLFYNNIGCIIQRTQDANSLFQLQMHDKSRVKRMKLPKNRSYGCFALKEKIFVCANSSNIIFQEEKQIKNGIQSWQIQWENIQGIAIGGSWLAAINTEEIKIFDFAGNQLHSICFDRKFVTIQAYQDLLVVVYHGGLPMWGCQNLKMKVYKITASSVMVDRDVLVPIKSNSILKWFGFSQQGMLVSQDTMQVVRSYSFNRNEWQVIFSLEGRPERLFIQHIQGSEIFGFRLAQKKNEREEPKVLPRSLPVKAPMAWPQINFQFFTKSQQSYLRTLILKKFILTHEEYRYENWYKLKYSRKKDHPWFEQSKTIKNEEQIKTIKTSLDFQLYNYLAKYLLKCQLKAEKYKKMVGSLLLVCERQAYLQQNSSKLKQLLSQSHNGSTIYKGSVQNIELNYSYKPVYQGAKCKEKINQISILQQIFSLVNYEIDM